MKKGIPVITGHAIVERPHSGLRRIDILADGAVLPARDLNPLSLSVLAIGLLLVAGRGRTRCGHRLFPRRRGECDGGRGRKPTA